MTLYRLADDRPGLEAPVLVAAFDGWVDAGRAGTAAAEQLAEDGPRVATFDADRLFDYRARRPTLDIIDGTLAHLEWPELHLRASRLGDRQLLVLSGPEPDYRWRQLAADVVELVRQLGVTSWVSLGAIPVAAPHTRPVRVMATASARGLLPPGVTQGPDGQLRVPSAALSVLELAVARAGIPALGFFAQVPHYVSTAYPNAAIELLRHVGLYLAEEPPLGGLPGKALETRALLDAAAAADEATKAHIERLEQAADEARLPAGDDLIADIERFLRERGGGGNGGGDERPN
ncbi:MAG TPA: PAC2 family protein [Candidatus Limnocylindria bacterium]|nr:PAC2 family protein [Candidatus Limnocylindria bacterium]